MVRKKKKKIKKVDKKTVEKKPEEKKGFFSIFRKKKKKNLEKPVEETKEFEKSFTDNQKDGFEEEDVFGQKDSVIEEKSFRTVEKESKTKKIVTRNVKTPVDDLFEILMEKKVVSIDEVTKRTNTNFYTIEKIAKIFEDYGVVDVSYSPNFKATARVKLKKEIPPTVKKLPEGKIIEEYKMEVDKVPANIKIVSEKEEARPSYNLELIPISVYTKRFLDFVKNQIAENIPIELDEIMDPKKSKKLKIKFFEESQKQLKKFFEKNSQEELNILSGMILHEMYGLGIIEVIMGDEMLEEVAINSSKTPISVYHRKHGWMKTNIFPGTEEEILNYSSQVGRKVGREITNLNPILDAHLLSGDRVNATLFPVSAEGNTLTIRKFAKRPWTLIDFIGKTHTMSSEMAALLWLAMQYEMNIIIAGGTASGKTSTLNTLLSLIPSYHRTITIEDVREIVLPIYLRWNWIPMVTRSKNPEGLGEVSMLDCMLSSLRMRPDRIIVGEIRRKREAEVLMEAIETGHSIYSTVHANSAYQVLRRMTEAPMSIPILQVELIDLIVVQFRDRKTNKRRTFEIAEVEQASSGKGIQVNTIYKWAPRTDDWEQMNKPTKLLTQLNIHTGMTESEIYKELRDRKKILDWMKEQDITGLNEIGYIVKLFYTDPEKVKKMASSNTTKKKLEGIMK